MKLIVTQQGRIRAIYAEAVPLESLGRLSIRRGSYVEPTGDGHWTADLAPVNGPVLGPFAVRSQALAAEVSWLTNHWLVDSDPV